MIAVGCCRCMRVMNEKGKPIGKKILHGGLIDMQELAAHFAGIEGEAATFEDRASADSAALGHGWQVIDGDHRCPECAEKERIAMQAAIDAKSPYAGMIARQGCYIDWDRQRMTESSQAHAGGK